MNSMGNNIRRRRHLHRITGIILAGGRSRRMGCDKSLLPLAGGRFIERACRCLASLFEEVIVVTNSPERYVLPCRMVPDLFPGGGPLVGIYSGLSACRTEKAFVVACDMPFLNAEVIQRICVLREEGDVVLPRRAEGREPLHALYDRCCLPAVEACIDGGERKISSFFGQMRVHEVAMESFADCDPQLLSFRNINTPEQYFAAREHGVEVALESPATRVAGDSAEIEWRRTKSPLYDVADCQIKISI